jgi:nicotinamide phosphoribosyltransferase
MSFKPNSLFYTDGYKIGHKKMLAPGTVRLYGTDIPRSFKRAPQGIKKAVSFGQRLAWKWLRDEFAENFFALSLEEANAFGKDMSMYLGMDYDASHFESLHKLGYLPIRVKALPEGIETPNNIPHMTFINTVDGFAWLTLYLETIVSALSWKPSTSATLALQYRRNAVKWVMKTDPANAWVIPFLCHDFSARGLDPWNMMASGLGHATSFLGSDSIIVIPAARYFYNEPKDQVAIYSVNASEHSVSTTKIFTVGEKQMIADWLTDFPKGILSIVSDTTDLTRLVKPEPGGYVYDLKEQIMARDGKLVIRPDSNPSNLTPVDIICGHNNSTQSDRELEADYPEFYKKGLIQCLWDTFGGTMNDQGYKVLDPHIGAIYGDAITLERQVEIYERLEAKGFAATNIVLGVGSFTYQMNTRDTLGYAIKGAWFVAVDENGVEKSYDIFKDPITDDGTKKSLKGRCAVHQDESGEYYVKTECTTEEEAQGLLEVIFEDGVLYNETTLSAVREKINALSLINE